ncbi:UNVERIFIED_CONTAM: hypothetical protein Scaly_1746000 [Sesamum calycinum]|uniref:Uncharacterized protein n=1 Tax=Sesamum calycinum TaxID=2727403 RepID=A0AAW2NUP6_9LAMI
MAEAELDQSDQAPWPSELVSPTYPCLKHPSNALVKVLDQRRRVEKRPGRRRLQEKQRSKSTSSKSPASSDRQTNPSSTSNNNMSTNSGTANILGLTPQLPPLRFMSPLSQLTDNFNSDMGLNFSGISAPAVGTNEMNFHGASNLLSGAGGVASLLSSSGGGIEPWRLQQFPFLGGLEASPSGIYQFHGGESAGFMGGETSHQVRPKLSSSMLNQRSSSVKMEENPAEANLSRQLLGGMGEQWNTSTAWTELSSFSSSSTSNPL